MTLKEWRLKKKWTQKQLADALDAHDGQVSRWESGERLPDLSNADKILRLTKNEVTMKDLLKASREAKS